MQSKLEMKTLSKILLAILICHTGVNAQYVQTPDAKVKWGDEYEPKGGSKGYMTGIAYHDDQYFVAVRKTPDGRFLELHSTGLEYLKSVELKLTYGDNELSFESSRQINGKLYVFSTFLNRSDKMKYLFVETIDIKTLKQSGDIKKIGEVPVLNKRESGGFGFSTSNDDSEFKVSSEDTKILVTSYYPNEKSDLERLKLQVFNSEMDQIWSKSVQLPYKDELFLPTNIQITDQGNIYFLGKIYNEQAQEQFKGEVNYSYKLFSYTENGDNHKIYDIELDDKFFYSLVLSITKDENFVLSGLYSSELYYVDGLIYSNFDDKSKKIIKLNTKEINDDFIISLLDIKTREKLEKKSKKEKNIEFANFILENLFLKEDNGILLVVENKYTRTVREQWGNTYYNKTYFHYNDIIIISVSSEGNIEWTRNIPKRQLAVGFTGHLGFKAFSLDSELYIMFNDNVKNYAKNLKPDDLTIYPGRKKHQIVSLVKIDRNGTISKKALFRRSDAEVILQPRAGERLDKYNFLIFGETSKISRFGSMSFTR